MNQQEITSNNFVEKVLESVKHYDKEPTYWLRISKDYQSELEIFVNDMPVFKDYDLNEGYNVGQDINFVILKSGEQKVRYKIYSKEKEKFVGIEIVKLDNKGPMKVADEIQIKNYENTVQIPTSGIYEETFTFQANVPYENKGWSDGQDLTKYDKKKLENAVVAFYKKMWNIYNDKSRKEDKFPFFYNREVEMGISNYVSKKTMEDILSDYLLPYTNSSYEMLPLENYKMVFYGDGKAVALEQTSMVIQLRGYSALGAKYKTEMGSTLGDMSQMILYLPSGKKLKDGLQIIR